jgi:hypothetical protein
VIQVENYLFVLSPINLKAVSISIQRSSENEDQKCDPEAFNHVSTVGRSCEAAEQNINSIQGFNGRQVQATESNIVLTHGTICSDSEIGLISKSEDNITRSCESSSHHYFIFGSDAYNTQPVSSPEVSCTIPNDQCVEDSLIYCNEFVSSGTKHKSSSYVKTVTYECEIYQFLQKEKEHPPVVVGQWNPSSSEDG